MWECKSIWFFSQHFICLYQIRLSRQCVHCCCLPLILYTCGDGSVLLYCLLCFVFPDVLVLFFFKVKISFRVQILQMKMKRQTAVCKTLHRKQSILNQLTVFILCMFNWMWPLVGFTMSWTNDHEGTN